MREHLICHRERQPESAPLSVPRRRHTPTDRRAPSACDSSCSSCSPSFRWHSAWWAASRWARLARGAAAAVRAAAVGGGAGAAWRRRRRRRRARRARTAGAAAAGPEIGGAGRRAWRAAWKRQLLVGRAQKHRRASSSRPAQQQMTLMPIHRRGGWDLSTGAGPWLVLSLVALAFVRRAACSSHGGRATDGAITWRTRAGRTPCDKLPYAALAFQDH